MFRELTPRVYLAGCLAKAGYRVYIGSKSGIYNLIENVYKLCQYSFGFTTFPANNWD